jgi:hypothetical protein
MIRDRLVRSESRHSITTFVTVVTFTFTNRSVDILGMNQGSENADEGLVGAILEPQHVTSDPKPPNFELATPSEIEAYKTAVNEYAAE